jgi:hypothetical protein
MTQPNTHQDALHTQARTADGILMAALVLYALVGVALGFAFERPGLSPVSGVLWAIALALPGALGFFMARGSTASRLLMALSLSALVALHIQVSAGMVEFHLSTAYLIQARISTSRNSTASSKKFSSGTVSLSAIRTSGMVIMPSPVYSTPKILGSMLRYIENRVIKVFSLKTPISAM